MNKQELIRDYKKELDEIKTLRLVSEQTLQAIARRESALKSALEKLGSKVPTPRGKKSVLSDEQKLKLKASLTR